jgi:hypothetical protein
VDRDDETVHDQNSRLGRTWRDDPSPTPRSMGTHHMSYVRQYYPPVLRLMRGTPSRPIRFFSGTHGTLRHLARATRNH